MNGIINLDCLNHFPFINMAIGKWNSTKQDYDTIKRAVGASFVVYPVILEPNDYNSSDIINIQFNYSWDNYPQSAKDITTKLYSKMDL